MCGSKVLPVNRGFLLDSVGANMSDALDRIG